jgi:hypothetical protein
MPSAEELAEVKDLCSAAACVSEGAQIFVDLPGLKIPVGDKFVVRNGLLTLQAHGGYASRLFLSEPISGKGNNWTAHTVLGRQWHTPSWSEVPPARPIEMLQQHLKVYR